MKVLFLDIDGVLNSRDYMLNRRHIRRPTPHAIDAEAVPRLNAVTDRTGAALVISSTWRLGKTVDQLEEILRAHGVTGEVAGKTPELLTPYGNHPEDDTRIVASVERGVEIQAWLDEVTGPPFFALHVERFAIVDDNSDMAHLKHRLVRTTFERGLQDEHVERLVAMLGGES